MKIGLISTYSNQTPPLTYGGEIYYWGLADTLGKMGHEVHLFATGGSQCPTNGELHYIKSTSGGGINYALEDWLFNEYRDLLMSMDIVHDCSLDHITAEKLKNLCSKKEIVNTLNGRTYRMPRPPFNVVTGSKFWQEDAWKWGLKSEMIYWGIDTNFYVPGENREDYYLWLARFHPDKGIDTVLDLAEYLGFPLKVAGSLLFKDHANYGRKYISRINNIPNVEYIDLPTDSTHHIKKRELYQKAKAFLYPVNYEECFGLVVVEALACGCPVITNDRGAMPELVEHKRNGFVCKTKHDYTSVILDWIPSYEINNKHYYSGFDLWKNAREKALEFSWERAAVEYEQLYKKVIGGYGW